MGSGGEKVHTHYDNLKVARDAPQEVIRAAYRSLSQKFHPDRNPGNAEAARIMALLNKAYEVLSDPTRRAAHDAWVQNEEAALKEPTPKPSAKAAHSADSERFAQPTPPSREFQDRQNTVKAKQPRPANKPKQHNQLAIGIVIAIAVIAWAIWLGQSSTPKTPLAPASATSPLPVATAVRAAAAPAKHTYVRPRRAPNGNAWPTSAGYVDGYPQANSDGLSTVTIDNTRNDSDVFLKLIYLETGWPIIARVVFIPAHGTMIMENVTAGRYDVRYRDLGRGGVFRTEQFNLEEHANYDDTTYSNITMTLYKVPNGNMHIVEVSDAEFE